MVADEPVRAELLAQLLEQPRPRSSELCAELADAYDEAGHGFALVAGGRRLPLPEPPRPGPLRRALRARGPAARLSAAALETLAIVAYKQPVSRAQIASIRGVNVDGVMRTLQARGYIDRGRPATPARARPCCTARPPAVPRASSASTRSTTCRRWPSSCPAPRWSRRSSTACASTPGDCRSPSRHCGSSGRPSVEARSDGRLAPAAEGAGRAGHRQPAALRGADRRRAGHGQRRGRRARPAGRPRARRGRGRRRARSACAPASSTTC